MSILQSGLLCAWAALLWVQPAAHADVPEVTLESELLFTVPHEVPDVPLAFARLSPDARTLLRAYAPAQRSFTNATTLTLTDLFHREKPLARRTSPLAFDELRFSKNGRFIFGFKANASLGVYSATDLTPVSELATEKLHAYAESPDGRFFVIQEFDHAVRIFDTQTGAWSEVKADPVQARGTLLFSPDARYLIRAQVPNPVLPNKPSAALDFIRLEKAQVELSIPENIAAISQADDGDAPAASLRASYPSADLSHWLILSLDKREGLLWNLASGEKKPLQFSGPVNEAKYGPSGSILASASEDGKILLESFEKGLPSVALTMTDWALDSLTWSLDGTELSAHAGQSLLQWKTPFPLSTPKLVASFKLPIDAFEPATLVPADPSRSLYFKAVGDYYHHDDQVDELDIVQSATGVAIAEVQIPGASRDYLQFSPDGKTAWLPGQAGETHNTSVTYLVDLLAGTVTTTQQEWYQSIPPWLIPGQAKAPIFVQIAEGDYPPAVLVFPDLKIRGDSTITLAKNIEIAAASPQPLVFWEDPSVGVRAVTNVKLDRQALPSLLDLYQKDPLEGASQAVARSNLYVIWLEALFRRASEYLGMDRSGAVAIVADRLSDPTKAAVANSVVDQVFGPAPIPAPTTQQRPRGKSK